MKANTPTVALTKRVVRGLANMKSACEAAPSEVLFGLEHDDPALETSEYKRDIADYEAAVRWIEYQQRKRGE